MSSDCKTTTKKCLMDSLETLNGKVGLLTELTESSNELLRKFTDPHQPSDAILKGVNQSEGNIAPPDLLDLFYLVADKIQSEINIIKENLSKLHDIVD